MKTKNLLKLSSLALIVFYLPTSFAGDTIAQSLQIYTHFNKIVGNPSWLLELRDVESGQVFPYLFDINSKDNFWIAFTKEHAYQVVASQVKFDNGCPEIHNFCHLENGILRGKSMYITLTGTISPNRWASECHVQKYSDTHFVVVKPQDIAPPPAQTATGAPPIQNTLQSIAQNPLVSNIVGKPQTPAAPTTPTTTTAPPAQAKTLSGLPTPPTTPKS